MSATAASEAALELVVCTGSDSVVVPFAGEKSYAAGSTLRLRRGNADSLTVARKQGEEWENLATLYKLPEGYELALPTVIAEPGSEVFRLTLKAGDQVRTQEFKLSTVDVLPCKHDESAAPPYADELRQLVKLVNAPTTQTLEEYKENAVVEVNAATGAVTPAERSKIRRGHFLIVKVINGLIYSCSVQVIAEGGSVRELPCGAQAVPGTTAAYRGVVPFAAPVSQLAALDKLTESQRVTAIRSAMAAETRADPAVTFSQNLPVLASYRETVVFLRVLPAPQANAAGDKSALTGLRDVTLTVNAQKWGAGPGAGFVLAVPGGDTFEYAATDDPTKKRVVRSSSSDADPMPFAFLNLWPWERSQWGWSLGVGIEPDSQQAAFALGGTYRFSGHAQVTLGVALVPTQQLPEGFDDGTVVPVGDTTLQSLDFGQEARLFIGIGWHPGSQDDPSKASETEPSKP